MNAKEKKDLLSKTICATQVNEKTGEVTWFALYGDDGRLAGRTLKPGWAQIIIQSLRNQKRMLKSAKVQGPTYVLRAGELTRTKKV